VTSERICFTASACRTSADLPEQQDQGNRLRLGLQSQQLRWPGFLRPIVAWSNMKWQECSVLEHCRDTFEIASRTETCLMRAPFPSGRERKHKFRNRRHEQSIHMPRTVFAWGEGFSSEKLGVGSGNGRCVGRYTRLRWWHGSVGQLQGRNRRRRWTRRRMVPPGASRSLGARLTITARFY